MNRGGVSKHQPASGNHGHLHRAPAAAEEIRSRARSRALRVRARRLFVLGVPVRPALDAAAPDVAGAGRLHRRRGRRCRSRLRLVGASSGGCRVRGASCWRFWSAWKPERCGASRLAGGAGAMSASIVGDDRDTAERRFFDSWVRGETLAPMTPPMPRAAAPAASAPARRPAPDVIGLFPQPGAQR